MPYLFDLAYVRIRFIGRRLYCLAYSTWLFVAVLLRSTKKRELIVFNRCRAWTLVAAGLLAVASLFFVACTSDDDPVNSNQAECTPGSEGCECYGNDTCDELLACLEGSCVGISPQPDADFPEDTDGMPDTNGMPDAEPMPEPFEPPGLQELENAEQAYDFRQTRTCVSDGPTACEPDEDPLPVMWFERQIDYQIHQDGSANLHSGEEITDPVRDSVIAAFDAWADQDCTGLDLTFDGLTDEDTVGYAPEGNNANIVVWRDDSWPYGGFDGVALSTVTFQRSTGEVLDADIELNTADYDFSDSDTDVKMDLRNVLTREVGHFLGFDNSPEPEATMYDDLPEGETKKRDLHTTDIEGLCFIYPE